MPKKVLIALPPAMLEQIDKIAEAEHRTRSDLVRESLRRYMEQFRKSHGGSNIVTLHTSASGITSGDVHGASDRQ